MPAMVPIAWPSSPCEFTPEFIQTKSPSAVVWIGEGQLWSAPKFAAAAAPRVIPSL